MGSRPRCGRPRRIRKPRNYGRGLSLRTKRRAGDSNPQPISGHLISRYGTISKTLQNPRFCSPGITCFGMNSTYYLTSLLTAAVAAIRIIDGGSPPSLRPDKRLVDPDDRPGQHAADDASNGPPPRPGSLPPGHLPYALSVAHSELPPCTSPSHNRRRRRLGW